MLLITKLGDNADKFFPITAVDFDEDIFDNAKNGYMDLSAEDEVLINKYTGNNLNKFFERTDKSFLSDRIGSTDNKVMLTRFKMKPILKDKVVFKTADINDYVDELPSENNIIFCRNCWPYLYKTSNKVAEKISLKLDDNSFLIVGDYDGFMLPIRETTPYGFSMSKDFNNVYDKSGTGYFDNMRWVIKYKDLVDDTI